MKQRITKVYENRLGKLCIYTCAIVAAFIFGKIAADIIFPLLGFEKIG
ncbi:MULTISPECIES: hypothetical protein [unclassified Enterococcus]|nr:MULTISPECIES: hypothetical protein [unclassified Enterococcus]MCA5013593.1 hypothetical protein [Enterococcus sp. S23]MCA5016843.1 hypothetical protein [Enterococcus sp. S22(2020)]